MYQSVYHSYLVVRATLSGLLVFTLSNISVKSHCFSLRAAMQIVIKT